MADNKESVKSGESIMQEYLRITSQMPEHNPQSNSGLKLGESYAIKPNLTQVEQDWVDDHKVFKEQKELITESLRVLDNANKSETIEANKLRKEFLNIEYRESLHTEEGRKNPFTQQEAKDKKYDVPFKDDKINGMVYANDGQSPRPDLENPDTARNVWLSGRIDAVKTFSENALNGLRTLTQDYIQPTLKEASKAALAAAIDYRLPTPSKVLLRPSNIPEADFLRDAAFDGIAEKAGIDSPSSAAVKILDPPIPQKRTEDYFRSGSSINENLVPSTLSDNQVAAFLKGDPKTVASSFPGMSNAYAMQALGQKHFETDGYLPQEQSIIMAQINQRITQGIQNNNLPTLNIDTLQPAVEMQAAANHRMELSRG